MDKKLLIYKASAGSGKTFMLVKEYLKLALGASADHYFKHILAITFTNKAAKEMKDRVFESLAEVAKNERLSTMAEMLIEELSIPKELLVQKAENMYREMVYNYSEIAICTIDSFVVKLVKGFAKELDLPSQFEVQLNNDEVLDRALDRLIEHSENNEYIKNALVDLITYRLGENKRWDFLEDLKDFSKNIFLDKSQDFLKKLADVPNEDLLRAKNKAIKVQKELKNEINTIAQNIKKDVENCGLAMNEFAGKKSGFMSKVDRYSEQFSTLDRMNFTRAQLTKIESDFWFSKTDDEKEAIIEPFREKWRSNIHVLQELYGRYLLYQSINSGIFSLILMNEVSRFVKDIKDEDGTVLLSDNHLLINEIVQDNPIPFIYERIGEKYHHLMIDEFQDTSVTQFQNTIPLVENSLGGNNQNLIVGDTKQSIYRFRNGEFEQLARLPHSIFQKEKLVDGESREQFFRRHGEELELNHNFRSKNELVQFNNDFFQFVTEFIEGYSDLRNSYSSFKQKYGQNEKGGLVRIEKIEKEDYKENSCQSAIKHIRECIKSGYLLSDIAILIRTKKDGEIIAKALSAEGDLPFISQDSLLFSSSKEINLIVNMIKQLNTQDELISGVAILNYLLKENVNDHLHQSAKEFLYKSVNDKKRYDRFKLSKCLKKFEISFSFHQENFSLVETVYAVLSAFHIQLNDAFVEQFIDEIHNFNIKKGNDISQFLQYWTEELGTKALSLPDAENAIKLLTIHKSKGLEFPIVILPFLSFNRGNKADLLWFDEKENILDLPVFLARSSKALSQTIYEEEYLEEENYKLIDNINLLYVAMTRAADRIYIHLQELKIDKAKWINDKTKDPEKWLSLFLHEQISDGSEWQFGEGKHKKPEQTNDAILEHQDYYQKRKNWKQKLVAENKKSIDNYAHYERLKEKKIQGILVHQIFENSNDLKEISSEVLKMLKLKKIDNEEKDSLIEKFGRVLANEEISKILNIKGKVLNESNLVDEGGNVSRPDRMIIHDKGLEIIDFKTGDIKEDHKKQLNDYAKILQDIGYSNIRKNLIYFNNEDIISWN